jgi:hypothetical protein
MAVPQPIRSPWVLGTFGVLLTVTAFGIGRQLGQHPPARNGEPVTSALTGDPVLAAERLPVDAGLQSPSAESVIVAQRKRIMGRLRSLEQVRRVATTIRPHVDRAIEAPSLQDDLRALARSAGMSLEQYKTYFKGKQEADLLLESGGDPSARSVADAIGVAQFMVGTGRRCGLRVDLGASNALTRKINALERQIDWLQAQPVEWARAVPPALAGVVPAVEVAGGSADASLLPATSTATAPGVWSRDQWLAYRNSQRETLVAKRRQADQRFDPACAVAAQTRYLVRLTRRYGGVDWALQAYHGGEAGASKTMSLFTGSSSRTLLASRGTPYGSLGTGRWLPYTELYQRVSPSATPAAFSYLFGRSDDHRYYWWKVLMAERALDLYRKDAGEFERQWQALQPGLNADAAFYPDPTTLQFADNSALTDAYRSGELVSLPRNAGTMGLRTVNVAALAPESTTLQKGLRPEGMGALLRLAQIYRSNGGQEPLSVLALVQSSAYRQLWDRRYPDPPLPPGVPRDPEFHTTGVTFDVRRPNRDWDRKVLEFSLGRLYDTLRISWRKENEAGSQRYHVVANPKFKDELTSWYKQYAR